MQPNTGNEPELQPAESLVVGLSVPQGNTPDAYNLSQSCGQDGYHFWTTALPKSMQHASKFPRSDVTVLPSETWQTSVVGLMEEEEEGDDNNDDDWSTSLDWAWHMSLPVVIIPKFPSISSTTSSSSSGGDNNNDGNATNDNTMQDADKDDSGDVPMEDSELSKNNKNGKSGIRGDATTATATTAASTVDTTTQATTTTKDPHTELLLYARKVGHAALKARRVNGHLWIPMTLPADAAQARALLEQWNTLNRLLDYPSNIGVLLDMKVSTLANTNAAEWSKAQVTFVHHLMGQVPVRGLKFCCSEFWTNKGGYPTLARGLQFVASLLLKRAGRQLRILVQGPGSHFAAGGNNEKLRGATGCLPYLQYLQHVRQRQELRQVLDSEQSRLEEDHCDRLQRPLQPLRDHLDNNTYCVFEKDPVKYREYRRAISMAMEDFALVRPAGKPSSPNEDGTMVIMVVGAGRGPLVVSCVEAFQQLPTAQRPHKLQIWAVEKNPSAVIYLQSLFSQKQVEWGALPVSVRVIHTDLRNLSKSDIQGDSADLVVSELLGSFGDNELSPECLDGLFTETNVCYDGTVSIPTTYTAFLAPVSSTKLHNQVKEQALYPNDSEDSNGVGGEGSGVLGRQVAFETAYVVRPRLASQMGTSTPCWTFSHPNTHHPRYDVINKGVNGSMASDDFQKPNEMNRFSLVEFGCDRVGQSSKFGCGYCPPDPKVAHVVEEEGEKDDTNFPWTLTGFLGTFSADLYMRPPTSSLAPPEKVCISTVPDSSFSEGMFSWFPLYFPLQQPLQVPGSSNVVVRAHMSRHFNAEENRVWYEWSATVQDKMTGNVLDSSAIHNPRGRSFCVSSL